MRLNHPQGQRSEDLAAAFLKRQGAKIIARNWHCAHGEIDLIAEMSGVLLFVEVRYRKNQRFGGAASSITPAKLGKIMRSAEHYLQQHPRNQNCRIDAILLHENQAIEWLQNISG